MYLATDSHGKHGCSVERGTTRPADANGWTRSSAAEVLVWVR